MYDISNISLFSGLSLDEQNAISDVMVAKIYPKGSLVIQEGELSTTFFILVTGEVEVFISNSNGDKYVLNVLGNDSFLGELAFLDEEKRTASVMALKETYFLTISKEAFTKILSDYPEIYTDLVKNLVGMVRKLNNVIRILAMKDTYGSLRSFLIERSDMPTFRKKAPKLTPEYVADQIGSSKDIVIRLLNKLEAGNYISFDNDVLFVLRTLPEKLQ